MYKFCPSCIDNTETDEIRQFEIVTVRGESFEVEEIFYRCLKCDEEYEISGTSLSSLTNAYNQYRARHNMLTPVEIKAFRRKYEFTQKELSRLLGWGAVTLSRYENGALQDLAHDKHFQNTMTHDGLLKAIELDPDALNEAKQYRIMSILKGDRAERFSIIDYLEEKLIARPPDRYNGFIRFNLEKFFGAIEFFCIQDCGCLKTKLNKLLYYADVLHFQRHTVSVTGTAYARLPLGPVPDDYKQLLAVMEEDLSILENEIIEYEGKDYTGERISVLDRTHIESLSATELQTLEDVFSAIGHLGSKAITDLSHEEPAWKMTEHAKLMAYAQPIGLN